MIRFRHCTMLLLLALLLGLSTASADNSRRAGSSPLKPKKDLILQPRTFVIAPYLTGGILVGSEAASSIPERGRRALYGFGLRLEYVPRTFVHLGISGEMLFAKVTDSDYGRGRVAMAGVSAMFLMYPSRPGSFFARTETGVVSVTATKYEDGSLGSYPYLRGGIGHQLFSTPTFATRVELYYQMALSKGKNPDTRLFRGEIPANGQAVGLEVGVGIGVL